MALDGFRQFLNAEINGAAANLVPVGVVVNLGECARLTDGEHDGIKLALGVGYHGGNGAKGITSGGGFVGADVSGVGQVTALLRGSSLQKEPRNGGLVFQARP